MHKESGFNNLVHVVKFKKNFAIFFPENVQISPKVNIPTFLWI